MMVAGLVLIISGITLQYHQMANLKDLPDSLAVFGGGVISVEYATVLALLGIPTSIICKRTSFLPFLPEELKDAIRKNMVSHWITPPRA